jgi:hypothetical protein
LKKLVFVLGIVFSSVVMIAQPTQCVADALQAIEDQGGLVIGSSYEFVTSGDDHIWLQIGSDGVFNTELFINNVESSTGFEDLVVGDIVRLDGLTIGLDNADSYAGSSGFLCADWGIGISDDLAVVQTLPVTWSQPTIVEIKNNKSIISFSTAQQINNSHFEIKHSQDGRQYQSIGKIEGEGNTTAETAYEYIHETPVNGINYYRVKQVDYDGEYSYSTVASVVFRSGEIAVYPNPVMGQLYMSSPSVSRVVIYNHLGQQVGDYHLVEGANVVDMTQMESGLYLLKFDDGAVERVVKR